jgi:hypothetical protein
MATDTLVLSQGIGSATSNRKPRQTYTGDRRHYLVDPGREVRSNRLGKNRTGAARKAVFASVFPLVTTFRPERTVNPTRLLFTINPVSVHFNPVTQDLKNRGTPILCHAW